MFKIYMRLFSLLALAAILGGCYEPEPRVYDRQHWLSRWSDADDDCQNVRHELLIWLR
ncbi:hypothetical protein [Microbulbifer sp. VAAF005]|uniref:hypothetical protein n=1 Tax=Microbulbifer sp. VAAF005 TaxID=3034230 RepID=UPI0024ACFADF|nr:hypothetical protein [Microbulbifer sp. VAAF005]WHI46773.1 hypothetical protein P0078_24265 [Microbulbifer sp. VAAF005]